jgi:lipopolysaccharide/colanic/teichoic acid biosynthesis glycosyltransferase
LKRLLDVVVSAVVLLLLSPLLLAVGIAVRVLIGRPVLFRQRRPGLHGVPFELLKFRTMTDAVDAGGRPLPDAQRLGRFGAMLRELSIDELPELVNVFRGEMSLVGPRPLLMQYLDRYDATQARRHDVSPGITGWAQINGRNAISWEERFALDVWYVDHRSLWLDLRILVNTVRKVFRREGITQPGHATMPEFTGRRS